MEQQQQQQQQPQQQGVSKPMFFKPKVQKQRKLMILEFQKNNKLFEHVPKSIWEVSKKPEQEADFIIEDSPYSFIFLSLKYHTNNSSKYIVNKLTAFAAKDEYKIYKKRILLLLCDIEDDKDEIHHLHKLCEEFNLIFLCGFTFQEISSYLSTFVQIANNASLPKQYLQGRKPQASQLINQQQQQPK